MLKKKILVLHAPVVYKSLAIYPSNLVPKAFPLKNGKSLGNEVDTHPLDTSSEQLGPLFFRGRGRDGGGGGEVVTDYLYAHRFI